MNSPRVQIVIPTFNRKDITLSCVNKLFNGTYQHINIIICDSSSKDGTQEALKENINITVVDVGQEKWWTGAVNIGIHKALILKPDYILLMNDDIDFSDTLVENMITKSKEFPNSIISPVQKTNSGLFLGINYSSIFKIPNVIFLSDYKKKEVSVQTSNGCCLLIPSKIFHTIGLFNEIDCPHLAGDTEFQLRAYRFGYNTIATTDIAIKQGKSTDYFSRVHLSNIFVHFASPVHFLSYWRFGTTLFNGSFSFIFLGLRYHFIYIKTVIKTLFMINKKSFKIKYNKLYSK